MNDDLDEPETFAEKCGWYSGDLDPEEVLDEFDGDEDLAFGYLWAMDKDD